MKKPFHIDSVASTDQIFALLDTMESNNEDETDKLMNDSDTESIVPKEIELTFNLDNASVLTPEANVYVHELETNKKKKSRKKIS